MSSGEEEPGAAGRGYTSDSEVTARHHSDSVQAASAVPSSPPVQKVTSQENWIIVNKDADITITSRPTSPIHSLVYPCKLMQHSTFALVRCWDSLAFIVRNVAHITPYNFESCVKCIRTFVEASLNGGNLNTTAPLNARKTNHPRNTARKSASQKRREQMQSNNSNGSAGVNSSSIDYPLLNYSDDDCDDNELLQRYEAISIQLLDLMHTLHTRTAQIFRWWAEESGSLPQCSTLWSLGWCPILQGIARLATDQRKEVTFTATNTNLVNSNQNVVLMSLGE